MNNKIDELYSSKTTHSSELLSFMYGSLMVRLTKDYKDLNEINKKSEEMGFEIGFRLLDDVLDELGKNIQTTNPINTLLLTLLKNFLGINGDLNQNPENEKEYHYIFQINHLALFVELPEHLKELCYSNIICGIIRGLLENANFKVECNFVKDKTKGDDINDIKIVIVEIMEERFIDDEN